MSDDIYDVPRGSLSKTEEERHDSGKHGITPRKSGPGTFFRKLFKNDDVDGVANIFGNAMINAIGDTIDEVTGNLTHRAKSLLYGTEDYDRGNRNRGRDRYNSYSKYYDERRGRGSSSSGSSGPRGSSSNSPSQSERSYSRWAYNDVFFSNSIFGGRRGAEAACWRVIKAMDDQISDPDYEQVSVADLFRFCQQEDPDNPKIAPEFTDERWGWDDEEMIGHLRPIAVQGGFIIELPKPKNLYN